MVVYKKLGSLHDPPTRGRTVSIRCGPFKIPLVSFRPPTVTDRWTSPPRTLVPKLPIHPQVTPVSSNIWSRSRTKDSSLDSDFLPFSRTGRAQSPFRRRSSTPGYGAVVGTEALDDRTVVGTEVLDDPHAPQEVTTLVPCLVKGTMKT